MIFKFFIMPIFFIIIFSGCFGKSAYDSMQFIQENRDSREITKEGIIPSSEKKPNYEEYKKVKE